MAGDDEASSWLLAQLTQEKCHLGAWLGAHVWFGREDPGLGLPGDGIWVLQPHHCYPFSLSLPQWFSARAR